MKYQSKTSSLVISELDIERAIHGEGSPAPQALSLFATALKDVIERLAIHERAEQFLEDMRKEMPPLKTVHPLAVPSTPKFEYMKRTNESDLEGLNSLGSEGWELCAILSGNFTTFYFFKREKR